MIFRIGSRLIPHHVWSYLVLIVINLERVSHIGLVSRLVRILIATYFGNWPLRRHVLSRYIRTCLGQLC